MAGDPIRLGPIRLGVAGLGRAFMLMLPTLARDPRLAVLACADPRAEARARFTEDFPGARAHETVEALCADPSIEAIYIATPHQFHVANVRAAAAAGSASLDPDPGTPCASAAQLSFSLSCASFPRGLPVGCW